MKTRLLFLLPAFLQLGAAAQTNTVSRLISTGRDAYANGAMAPLDSTQYYTSGNNICDLELGYQNDSAGVFTYYAGKGGFVYTMRTVNTLCPQGYLSSLQQNRFTNSDSLENSYLHTYAYPPGGAVMDTFFRWNTAKKKWEYSQLCADTLFDPKHIRVHYYAEWDSAGWTPRGKTVHTYTANGDADTLMDVYWDDMAKLWAPYSLMKYTYDGSNRLVDQTYWLWQQTTNSWQPSYKIANTFNSAGDSSIQQWLNWDKASNSWILNTRHTFSYDSKGKPLSDIQQYWTANTQTYVNWSRTTYTYNSYGQATSMNSERWNMLTSAFEFGFQSMKTRYHYEEYTPTPTLGVTATGREAKAKIYPNPSREQVWVDWKGTRTTPVIIQLLDMQGKPVSQVQKTASELHEYISTAQLPAGTYILQLFSEGSTTQHMLQVVH